MRVHSWLHQQLRFQRDPRFLPATGLSPQQKLLPKSHHHVTHSFTDIFSLLTAVSAFARSINAEFLIRVAHSNRILANTILMLLSFMLLAMSLANSLSIEGLYWCIIACICHGFAQAFGEATIMGYLKGLPSEMVQTFGSGTGLSGFTGVLTVLFLQALGISQGRVRILKS